MPIEDFRFEDGIYYTREFGNLTVEDARLWTEFARRYAQASEMPIVAVVNALDVEQISKEAQRVFARASHIPNLDSAAVATRDAAAQSERIGQQAVQKHTYVFRNLAEAVAYARQRLAELREEA